MSASSATASADITAALGTLPTGTPMSEVVRRLLGLFTGGSIAPGTRLPSERQLAASLSVGRSAIREALAALEVLGIVQVRPGSGTYLRGTASDLLPQSLSWGLLIGTHGTDELLELRSGLETFVARLAASHADADTCARLDAALQTMRDGLEQPQAFVAADLAFHHALADAAHNRALVDLVEVVRSLLRVYSERAVHDVDEMRVALAEHEAVRRAVCAGDGDAAASAMSVHMTSAASRLVREG